VHISFEPSPDYPQIAAAAGGAWGATIKETSEVGKVLQEAIDVVKGGRCAVVEVR